VVLVHVGVGVVVVVGRIHLLGVRHQAVLADPGHLRRGWVDRLVRHRALFVGLGRSGLLLVQGEGEEVVFEVELEEGQRSSLVEEVHCCRGKGLAPLRFDLVGWSPSCKQPGRVVFLPGVLQTVLLLSLVRRLLHLHLAITVQSSIFPVVLF
jgi:hypothetical protein